MYRTSLGFHTFTIFKNLTKDEADSLFDDLRKYEKNTNEIKIFPNGSNGSKTPKVFEIIYLNEYPKGINWKLIFDNTSSEFSLYSIQVTINPKILVGIKDYIIAATDKDLESVESIFNSESKKLSPILKDFSFYRPKRVDYCVNFDLKELKINCDPELMMNLIKRGNIPTHYKERTEYSDISKRNVTDKISFYLISKSVIVNCYWKYKEQERRSLDRQSRGLSYTPIEELEESRNIIRFEIQFRYQKVHVVSEDLKKNRNYQDEDSQGLIDYRFGIQPYDDLIGDMLSGYMCNKVISDYFARTIMYGDYYTLDKARKIIESHGFTPATKLNMIEVLELINKKRSIHKARLSLEAKERDKFGRILNKLVKIGINPVTIPREWKIDHIPNLIGSYYAKFWDKHDEEIFFWELQNENKESREKFLKEYLKEVQEFDYTSNN